MRKAKWPGDWKAACHVCGFWYPSSNLKHRWDGVLACPKDWEPRHPQTLIKVRTETAVPSFISKDVSPDNFVQFCDIQDRTAYADMGTADCSQADYATPAYSFLHDLDTNGHE